MGSDSHVVIVDTNAAASAVQRTPATIRRWAQRGLIKPCGTDGRRRRLWDLHEVIACSLEHPPREPTTRDLRGLDPD